MLWGWSPGLGVLSDLDDGRGLRESFCCPSLLLASYPVLILQNKGVQDIQLTLAGCRRGCGWRGGGASCCAGLALGRGRSTQGGGCHSVSGGLGEASLQQGGKVGRPVSLELLWRGSLGLL